MVLKAFKQQDEIEEEVHQLVAYVTTEGEGRPAFVHVVVLHDQFMLMKLVLNVATMKFHQKVYTFSLFQQLPYFEQSNRRSYSLQVFERAIDFAGNQLMLLYDD